MDVASMLQVSVLLFLVAALGGFYLAAFHLRGQSGPKPVVVVHALAAVAGVVLLAGAAFSLI